MTLDLIHSWHDPGRLDDLLQVLDREIADPDRLDLLCLLGDPDHLLPGSDDTRSIFVERLLSIGTDGLKGLSGLEGDGPVDEVDVKVGSSELFEREVEVGLDVLWTVGGVPQLRHDGDVLAGEVGSLDPIRHLIESVTTAANPIDRLASFWLAVRSKISHDERERPGCRQSTYCRPERKRT